MSNVGKTSWANRLEQAGFMRFSIDDMIEEKLGPVLQEHGFQGIHDVARWMGQPYDPQYPETSAQYLALENESMTEALDALEHSPIARQNVVIDTTGSVIHTNQEIQDHLQEKTTVVHLDTPPKVLDEMFQAFSQKPKPLIWGPSFSQEPSEEPEAALKRCYPQMLTDRSRAYQSLEHMRIPFTQQRSRSLTVEKFIALITNAHHANHDL